MKKFLISGTTSGVGKTTVTTAILSLLENPAPFKCGPDYIDPMFHSYVCGKPSINLDLFMMDEEVLKFLFNRRPGVKVLEGMMGLYDGLDHTLDNFSAAHISRVLKMPVLLIVDGTKVSTSIAATVKGFIELDNRVTIGGVIINRVSEAMYNHLKPAIEMHTGVPCLGYLPNDESIAISERHLGLMQANEISDLNERIRKLNETASKTIDIERILSMSDSEEVNSAYSVQSEPFLTGKTVAIARDLAFSFYYEDNIELIKTLGAKVVEFSPMKDKEIPECDVLYIGGGYPEVYANDLYENKSMLHSVREYIESEGVCYAECGGMIYLSKSIISDNETPMVGIYPHSVKMRDKLNVSRFGYIKCESKTSEVNAHEFHYSEIVGEEGEFYFDVSKRNRNWKAGFIYKNCIAGYPHIHFYSNIEMLKELFSR